MTREEQIKKQADIYTEDESTYATWSDDGGWSETTDIELIEKAFEEGAKWADETMIEKACEWLKIHQDDYFDYDPWKDVYVNFGALIEDFKKAMKNDEESNL